VAPNVRIVIRLVEFRGRDDDTALVRGAIQDRSLREDDCLRIPSNRRAWAGDEMALCLIDSSVSEGLAPFNDQEVFCVR
jgi:hypothetical protein